MSEKAIDISQWQGTIDWGAVDASIAIIKMSGGDDGLYYDSKATYNYYTAKATGKSVGMYHFAGGGDPVQEADFFLNGCMPFEQNDVFILDWEIPNSDPVGWCRAFIQHVIDRTGVRPLIYMNTSTENNYDWAPIVNMDIGLWVADYRFDPSSNVPVHHWPTYIMHQYTSSGRVPGISGNVDLNVFFGSTDQFNKYGWQPVTPAPTPEPVITTGENTATEPVPFESKTIKDPVLPQGQTKIIQQGVNGTRTIIYSVTYTDGVETHRDVKSNIVTTDPIDEVTAIGTYVQPAPEPTPEPIPSPLPSVLKLFIEFLKNIIRKIRGK